jgi:hypothetical protein
VRENPSHPPLATHDLESLNFRDKSRAGKNGYEKASALHAAEAYRNGVFRDFDVEAE